MANIIFTVEQQGLIFEIDDRPIEFTVVGAGLPGPQGDVGPTGPQGPPGLDGADGADGVTYHGALTGLDEDHHTQYAEVSNTEVITNQWRFDSPLMFGQNLDTASTKAQAYFSAGMFSAPGDAQSFISL